MHELYNLLVLIYLLCLALRFAGKTTFLGQASLDLAEQGINVLWGSFEIKNTRLMHKLLQQYCKDVLPVGIAEKDMSMEDKQKSINALSVLADKFESLPMHFMKFHGGSDVDDVLDAMEYAAYVHDVEHIILDNMQFMISRQTAGGKRSSHDKFDMQDIAIEKFRKFATEYNVHGESLRSLSIVNNAPKILFLTDFVSCHSHPSCAST